jgi:hypothetical protein
MTRILVVLFALSHGVLNAQQSPLAGTWLVNFQAGMRVEDGVATPLFATGTLTVQSVADSLIGTLATNPAPDMPARPPVRLAAKASTGEATFIAHGKATINVNGAEHEAAVVSTWVLRAKGDSLEGTVARMIDSPEAGPQEPRPVTGTRKKG